MKTIIFLAVFLSTPVFAATQLFCSVSENLNQPDGSIQTLNYDVTAPLADNSASTGSLQARSLKIGFGIETFLSEDLAPGKPYILISAVDMQSGIATSAGGESSAILYLDGHSSDFSVSCHLK